MVEGQISLSRKVVFSHSLHIPIIERNYYGILVCIYKCIYHLGTHFDLTIVGISCGLEMKNYFGLDIFRITCFKFHGLNIGQLHLLAYKGSEYKDVF